MKTILILLNFIALSLSANENWIKIEPLTDKKEPKKKNNKIDVNLSKIEPINNVLKNTALIQQILNATSKKETKTVNDKNWFILNSEENK